MPLSPSQYINVLECAKTFNITLFFECKACNQLFCTTVAFVMHKNKMCKEFLGDPEKAVFTQESLSKLVRELGIDLIIPVKKKANTEVQTEAVHLPGISEEIKTVLEPILEESSKGNKKTSKSRKQRRKLKQSQSMKQDNSMDVKLEADFPCTSTLNSNMDSNNKILKVTKGQPKIEMNQPKIEPNKPKITKDLSKVSTKKTSDKCSRSKDYKIMPLMPKLSKDSDDSDLKLCDSLDLFNKKLINWTEEDLSVECEPLLKYMADELGEDYFDESEQERNFSENIDNSNTKTGNTNTTINPENMVKGKTCKKNLNKFTKKRK